MQVQAGLITSLDENYLLASGAPSGTVLPTLVPFGEISDLADYPFGFNGQLETDVRNAAAEWPSRPTSY